MTKEKDIKDKVAVKEKDGNAQTERIEQELQDIVAIRSMSMFEKKAEILLHSNFAPDNLLSTKDAMSAIMYGDEIGVKPMSAMNNLHIISGKPTLSVAIYTALMIKHGITYEILEDYKSVYKYISKDHGTFSSDEFFDEFNRFQVVTKTTEKSDYLPDKIQVQKKLVDIYTKIKFTRKVQFADKTWDKMTITHSIYLSEMRTLLPAMFTKDSSQWVKQPRTMLRTRTLTNGARLINPDAFAGLYTDAELRDMNGEDYTFDEETASIIDITPKPDNEDKL